MLPNKNSIGTLPLNGCSKEEVLAIMQAARDHDLRWREGRVFSLVYNAGEQVSQVAKEAYLLFFSENGLNPTAFPSLKKFETEVVNMVGGLLGCRISKIIRLISKIVGLASRR
jgi:sphinganine-1-phosphate aldolase